MEAKEFGQYLRTLRKAQGLTIDELAAEAGVSGSYISQIENGKKGIPSPQLLQQIHTILDVSHEHLMEKAGYIIASEPLSQDLYGLFNVDKNLYYKGIKLILNQQRLLKELLEEFISHFKETESERHPKGN